MQDIKIGQRFGALTILELLDGDKCKALCDCGRISHPTRHNLLAGRSKSCGNCGRNLYRRLQDGKTTEVTATNGYKFLIDTEDEEKVSAYKWHVTKNQRGYLCVINSRRMTLCRLIMGLAKSSGYETDHINLDSLDNRKKNLRKVTHQQNQCNQPLQKNNTSGVTGVRFYPPRGKYSARLKIAQHEIHLGYYSTFQEAVQARNVGMECMFGEYGRYNDVPPAPQRIRQLVTDKCKRFAELSVNQAFSQT